MSKSCKPILVDNTPCNCVTAVTSAGVYGTAPALYPTTASLNALHTVQYDDRIVMYKRTATGWTEVQNYEIGGTTDTDTSIRFVQALPTGEWEWEIVDVITNTVLSTFTTPPIVATTVVSTDGSVGVVTTPTGYDLSVVHVINPDGSITLNDGTVIPVVTTVSSPTGSVDVVLNGNNYELEIDLNLPIFNTYAAAFNALGAGKKFRYSENNVEGVPSPNNSTLGYT